MSRRFKSSIAAAVAVALVVQLHVPAPVGAATYTVGILEHSAGGQIAQDQRTIPPATISGSWQNPMGPTTHYVHSYFARAGRTSIDMYADVDLWSHYVVYTDVHESGSFRWDDVVFTCLDGRPSVDVGINVDIHGTLSHVSTHPPDVGPPSAGLAVYLGSPYDEITHRGIWYPAGNIGIYNLPSTGVFAGIHSDVLDGRFSYSLGSRPTGTPQTIAPSTLTLQYGAHNGRVRANFDEATTGKPGMALPTDGPVFNLPAGCTCNSAEMGVIDNRISDFGVIRAEPPYGGDDGGATVIVIGTGFREGATVSLRRAGSADIVGAAATINTSGTQIATRFDLRGASRGKWDVIVQNPGGPTATKVDGFDIQAGTAPRLTLSAHVGRNNAIRINQFNDIVIYVTNHGNTDAVGVLLFLSGPPEGVDWIPDFTEFNPPGSSPTPPESPPFALAIDGVLHTGLVLSRVPAGVTLPLAFRLRTHTLQQFRLQARALGPILPSTYDLPEPAMLAADLAPLCNGLSCLLQVREVSLCLGLALPGLDCIEEFVRTTLTYACDRLRPLLNENGDGSGLGGVGGARVVTSSRVFWYAMDDAFREVRCFDPISELLGKYETLRCLYKAVQRLPDLQRCCDVVPQAEVALLANPLSGGFDAGTAPAPGSCGSDLDLPVYPVTATDPNDKTGSHTNSSAGYVSGDAALAYEVFFENLPAATAPARVVDVTDAMAPTLDLSSLQWGPIRIANHLVVPDPFAPALRETLDLRPQTDLLLAIAGDLVGGVLRWRFTSLDPATKLPPADPLAGFLPPNLNPPEGEGSVSMLLRTNAGLATNTEILNRASIVFDGNAPILTGTVVHRIDADAPQTLIQGLAGTVADPVIPLALIHGDLGSGIKDLTILVSENDGPYMPLPSSGPVSEVAFTGVPGHRYAFYSVGRDSAGNLEPPPATPDAVTRIEAPPPAVAMRFWLDPNVLNLRSRGRWVTGFLEPPAPYTADAIDVASITLNGTIPVDPEGPVTIEDQDGNGIPELAVKFSRGAVELAAGEVKVATMTVTGRIGGEEFTGGTTIQVIRTVVNAPAGGGVLVAGGRSVVSWEVPSGSENDPVGILASLDDGRVWDLIARDLPNTGRFDWTVPNASAERARLAVVHLEPGHSTGHVVDGVLGVSDRFSILAGTDALPGEPAALALQGTINPVRGTMSIGFSLPSAEPASLALFDVRGRLIASRAVGGLGPGHHRVGLEGTEDLPAGIYLIRLTQGGQSRSSRAVLIR